MIYNKYNQPVGENLADWTPALRPKAQTLTGRFCRLEALDVAKHSEELFEVYQIQKDDRDWTYLPDERPETLEGMKKHLHDLMNRRDLVNLTVIDTHTGLAVGTCAYMHIDNNSGVLELGYINWSPKMARKPIGTEAIFLMLCYTFDELGYRRCEWKCDSLNERSKNATLRFGFSHEGTFHQAVVTKGRNRDTNWYAITDKCWPKIKKAFEYWLSESNFDTNGRQIKSLKEFM